MPPPPIPAYTLAAETLKRDLGFLLTSVAAHWVASHGRVRQPTRAEDRYRLKRGRVNLRTLVKVAQAYGCAVEVVVYDGEGGVVGRVRT